MAKAACDMTARQQLAKADIVMFDLDGTLADIEHRQHFVRGKKKNGAIFLPPVSTTNRMWR